MKIYFDTYTKNCEYYPSSLRNKYLLNLRDLRKYIQKPCCNIYVATSSNNRVLGGIFYCSNMKEYGLKISTNSHKTCALRYLAVDEKFTGYGIAKALVKQGIKHAKEDRNKTIVLHTMDSMKSATKIYTQYGFKRYMNIDFRKNGVSIKGYRKKLI